MPFPSNFFPTALHAQVVWVTHFADEPAADRTLTEDKIRAANFVAVVAYNSGVSLMDAGHPDS